MRKTERQISLSKLSPGQWGRVSGLESVGSMRRRLRDIGIGEDTKVQCVGKSPLGDPAAYLIQGAVIALRREDSEKIYVILQ